MFISSYTTIYFFVNNFFFKCSYVSEYDIQMLFVFWLRNRPSIKYVQKYGNGGGHPKCIQVQTRREGYHTSCVHTQLQLLFSCFCVLMSCFTCRNLTLPSVKKGLFVRDGYAFNLKQIESYIYSIF